MHRKGSLARISICITWLLVISLILLVACQATSTAAPVGLVSPTAIATSTWTPVPTFTPSPTLSSINSHLNPHELLTSDFKNESFHGLILFTSAYYEPFPDIGLQHAWANANEPHLYAVSPDGLRAGALSPDEFSSAIYLPSDSSMKPMIVAYGIELNHPAIQSVPLPTECYQPEKNEARLYACTNFQFSPDGRYFGFLYGRYECLRAIQISDLRTGARVFDTAQPNGHYFSLLNNGNALIATGHCEGGGVDLYDLASGIGKALGAEGQNRWNVDGSALAVEVNSYSGMDSHIWGFNFDTNKHFLVDVSTHQIDDHPVWTPDKNFLLYQHRTYAVTSDGFSPIGFDAARQIILVNALTGEKIILLSNPDYDFHIGVYSYNDKWYGDWIKISRVAFTPEPLPGGEAMFSSPQYQCRTAALNCVAPVELFALNWKTGELVAWEKMIQNGLVPSASETPGPDKSATPVFEQPQGRYTLYAGSEKNTYWMKYGEGNLLLTGPNLTTAPVYKDPNGQYAFYVGIDGQTLWHVPVEGQPELWVINGQNYFYIP